MVAQSVIHQIVDMTRFAASSVDFSQVYQFPNGASVIVSRNAMIGGNKSGFMGILPHDKDGNQLDALAETWLTAEEVADKMFIHSLPE